MHYMVYGLVALAVLVALAYLLLSRKQTRDIIIWMRWPPPLWAFVLAGVVVIAAAAIMFARG
jgi:drug/metabolite transporter (DMT)-like permease